MTEDMLQEHAEVLTQLGTTEEGSRVRAQMQCASLLSDMESFKVLWLTQNSGTRRSSSSYSLHRNSLDLLDRVRLQIDHKTPRAYNHNALRHLTS